MSPAGTVHARPARERLEHVLGEFAVDSLYWPHSVPGLGALHQKLCGDWDTLSADECRAMLAVDDDCYRERPGCRTPAVSREAFREWYRDRHPEAAERDVDDFTDVAWAQLRGRAVAIVLGYFCDKGVPK